MGGQVPCRSIDESNVLTQRQLVAFRIFFCKLLTVTLIAQPHEEREGRREPEHDNEGRD